jgi:hypothetical protein
MSTIPTLFLGAELPGQAEVDEQGPGEVPHLQGGPLDHAVPLQGHPGTAQVSRRLTSD